MGGGEPTHLPTPPPTYFSHGHLTVCVRLLSQMRGLSANPGPSVSTRLGAWGGHGLWPADPAALTQWQPGHFSWLSFLSFLSLSPALLKITGRDQSIISYL